MNKAETEKSSVSIELEDTIDNLKQLIGKNKIVYRLCENIVKHYLVYNNYTGYDGLFSGIKKCNEESKGFDELSKPIFAQLMRIWSIISLNHHAIPYSLHLDKNNIQVDIHGSILTISNKY